MTGTLTVQQLHNLGLPVAGEPHDFGIDAASDPPPERWLSGHAGHPADEPFGSVLRPTVCEACAEAVAAAVSPDFL